MINIRTITHYSDTLQMIWKCRPDTQFEEEEKNKKPYMSWMSDQFVHNRAGGGCGLDTNRPSRQWRCKIISGTVRCESNKLHMDLLWPNSSHFHRRAGTEEFDWKKKILPKFNRAKNNQLRDCQKTSRESSWRQTEQVTGMGKILREYVGGDQGLGLGTPVRRHGSKDMFSVRERKLLERAVVPQCSGSQGIVRLKKKKDFKYFHEGEPMNI